MSYWKNLRNVAVIEQLGCICHLESQSCNVYRLSPLANVTM